MICLREKIMKATNCLRLIIICSAAILLNTCSAIASLATIFDQQCHISGYYNIDSSQGLNGNYDMTGQAPISSSTAYNSGIYASSSVDLFKVTAFSSAYSNISGTKIMGTAQALAEGSWTFLPPQDCHSFQLQINVYDLWLGDKLTVQLSDVTSGEDMYYFYGQPPSIPHWQQPFVQSFTVNPDHQYYLHANIASTAGTDGPWSGSVSLITPEPATLFLITLGGLILRKK